jgi:uncharacterized protein (TIGR02118 family)
MKVGLLIILATLATTSVLQAQPNKTTMHDSAAVEKGLIKISILYPFAEGKTFNMAYYESKHMPMVAAFIGSNLVKYTIEKGVANGMPNQPLPYMAVGAFYVKSLEAYQTAIAPHRDAIRADFANYTSVTPVILVSEVVK